jgi:membrane associated rhomboid family serine protease
VGWQDRDYAREYHASGSAPGWGYGLRAAPWRVSILLIVVNVAVFAVDRLSDGRLSGVRSREHRLIVRDMFRPDPGLGAMSTPEVLHGQVWRLITSQYLHVNTWHIFLNMLGLYFLGGYLESAWGRLRFFIFYTACGLAGNLFYMALNMVHWLEPLPAIGASGCILGVLGACAVLFPGIQLIVYFFPMRIRTAAFLFLALYALNLTGRGYNAGGDAAHLAGLVTGAGYALACRRNILGPWSSAGGMRRVRARVSVPSREDDQTREAMHQEVDRILRKIQDEGIASLSESEKHLLAEASRQQRAAEARYGRTDRL